MENVMYIFIVVGVIYVIAKSIEMRFQSYIDSYDSEKEDK